MAEATPRLVVRGLSKRFPGVQALDKVDLTLYPGEVLAVIGENGAGKSTLMKILAGVHDADAGEVIIEGEAVEIGSVREAQELGVSLIHQELNLSDNLDVAANLFLGREPRRAGFLHKRVMRTDSLKLLERVGLRCSPRTLVSRLSIGHQQMVEIAKALAVDARILIMDEPTSSLTHSETEQLYKVIRDLRATGVSIIYISHRLGEVRTIADRVTVLRDGQNAGELNREEITHDRMVQLMVGREVARAREHTPCEPGPVVLRVDQIRTRAYPQHPLSFSVHAGEIVGIAGLVGAGRTELLEALFGVTPAVDGIMAVEGKALRPHHPKEAIAAGIALVPEDRKEAGLILEMSVRDNLSLAALRNLRRLGFIDFSGEKTLAADEIERLNIRTPDAKRVVQVLSGGNQQKVVLGKWLALKPRLLLLDEPTRGIDVGAKSEVYRLMEALADDGVAVVFVSSELEEILSLSDRALVMHEGRVTGELRHDALTEEAVMHLAVGGDAVRS